MPYGKQRDFAGPTLNDFETKATPEEKRLWEDYLKDYPENFQRSAMADVDHFLFVCPSANLAVDLEKFPKFSDTAGGVSGKKGDALREMGLSLKSFTNRELNTNFDAVCAAIDRAVKRGIDNKSLVEIKRSPRLPLDDDGEVTIGKGWKMTVSGEYKDDEPVGYSPARESVQSYGGNSGVVNPLDDNADEGYTYTRFNKRYIDSALPNGNWQRQSQSSDADDEKKKKTNAPAEDKEGVPFSGGSIPDIPAPELAPRESYIAAGETYDPKSAAEIMADAEAKAADLTPDVPDAQEEEQAVTKDVDQPAKVEDKPKINPAVLAAEEHLNHPERVPKGTFTNTTKGKHLFIADSADIVGEVHLGDDVSVWYQAVVRADQAPICIGDGSNVQDGTIMHVSEGYPTVIGNHVTIGHNCTIHGCTIDDDVLIGMGTVVLNGAHIPSNCIIGAKSLVTQNKTFPEGKLIMGSPAKVVRDLTPEEIAGIRENADEYVKLMDNNPGKGFFETEDGVIIVRDK